MLHVDSFLSLPLSEIELNPIRAQGAGGQNVNKVSTAVHLRFDISASSLPKRCKDRLLAMRDQRISAEGIIIIKAQRHRSREKNRSDALERLRQLIAQANTKPKVRRPTRPTRRAKERRLEQKVHRGAIKKTRGKVWC